MKKSKNSDYQPRKAYISFYIEKQILDDIEEIVNDPYTMFDDRSQLIRHCVKMQLPTIKKEIKENKTP